MKAGTQRALHCLLALLVIGIMLGAGAARAQSYDPWAPFLSPWFERVGTTDGLPHSVTTAVAQDRRGLVWIGTMGGLTRFDGYRVQVFEAQGAAGELPDAYVRTLLALPDGGVLVGTNAGGLARLDPRTNRFHTYAIGRGGTADGKIYTLAADGERGAWVASDRGLDYLDFASDVLTRVDTGSGEIAARNFSVLQDRHGTLWLGNDRGLFRRAAGQHTFVRASAPADRNAQIVLRNQIWALHEDSAGRIWIGSGQAGAAYRDTDGRWHAVPGYSGSPREDGFATVRALTENGDGTEWIGTDGNGVLSYRAGDSDVHSITHDAAVPSSLPGDSVRGLLHDATGNLWVATNLGIAHTNPLARTVCSLLPSPTRSHGLSDSNVHAVLVDRRGRIWLGLGNGRIDLIDLGSGRMTHLQIEGAQRRRDVQALLEAEDGTIWVGTQGLARIDPDTLAITANVEPRLLAHPVLSLLQVDDMLLAGTYDGVYRYYPDSGRLEHFSHSATDPGSLASDTVRQIARLDDRIWYGTTRGMSVARSAQDDTGFEHISHRDAERTPLPQDFIGSIAADAQGRLWLATFGGLAMLENHRLEPPYRFRVFGTESGLASDKINAVQPDPYGHVWVSMSTGVAMVDSATGTVYNLGARDGLHIPSYIYVAAARAPDGALLFGGLGGLTIVRDPRASAPAVAVPAPTVTEARIDGVAQPFGDLPDSDTTIRLQRGSRSLRLGFAVLDYRAASETRYSYRLEGFDDAWTEVPAGTPPSAVYTNLPHGQYTLRLRASTSGMHASRSEAALPVLVEPRWYESLWLRALMLLLGAAVLAAVIHLRTLYLRRQALRLQQQVDERTRDLQDANARLDQLAGTDELTGVYNRRRFLQMLEGVRELSEDGDACLAVLDLDRFKLINDGHGHLAGDAVIRTVTDIIVGHCSPGDIVGRYGGEELVICMPDCTAPQGQQAAERIRDALAVAEVRFGDHAIRVTTSIGVAAIRRGEATEQWLTRADEALYEAKRRGRNCSVLAP
ncbi:diguanylate cyclase [Dyella sp.]|jgi:diguanylate cyclase (GGDEF)-like protein|uniref:ligand-binding sensor domain-containing diguanylate cyclase n=1 Tax=Dyella sp. TaxID=1869338 RepID=UPI002D76807C|nr:diguanylate cyclase [Dyella sp.]HET6433524.1 diguanylate cyclase [Dyella sp.]